MDYSKNATVKIQGGLGNQLFQYSFAIFLKEHFKTNINLDLSWFDKQEFRKFQLSEILVEPLFETIRLEPSIYNKILSYMI